MYWLCASAASTSLTVKLDPAKLHGDSKIHFLLFIVQLVSLEVWFGHIEGFSLSLFDMEYLALAWLQIKSETWTVGLNQQMCCFLISNGLRWISALQFAVSPLSFTVPDAQPLQEVKQPPTSTAFITAIYCTLNPINGELPLSKTGSTQTETSA